jgi:hypothetical protein
MDGAPNVADAILRTTEAYTRALSMAMNFLATSSSREAAASPVVEHWLRLARMTKDGVILAIEQGYALWERECRRALAGGAAPAPPPPPLNPIEAWTESWRKALDSLNAAARPDDPWAASARQQAETMQRMVQDGLTAWIRLWQPPVRDAGSKETR